MLAAIGDEPDDEKIELFYLATGWIGYRYLSSLHLTEGPAIHIFRHGDEITIRWNNDGKCIDGIQVWSNCKGEEKYSVASFMVEVNSFHDRLMAAMDARVETMLNDNPISSVDVDMNALMTENRERKTWLARELNNPPKAMNTEHILRAVDKLTCAA